MSLEERCVGYEAEIEAIREWLVTCGLIRAEALSFARSLVVSQGVGSLAKIEFLYGNGRLQQKLLDVGMDEDNIGIVLSALNPEAKANAEPLAKLQEPAV